MNVALVRPMKRFDLAVLLLFGGLGVPHEGIVLSEVLIVAHDFQLVRIVALVDLQVRDVDVDAEEPP